MTTSPGASPRLVSRDSIRVGALLAEGGEGRVFELPLQPHLVFKEYRHVADRAHLEHLIRWPESGDPELTARVRSAASWPSAVVERGGRDGARSRDAVGVLVARAGRRFSVRHRDGTTRLASLSYLTADPSYREVAYGLSLPSPFTPERLGLVYALARVLEAFERLEPRVGHGDLSAKNVLWSLQRGPEVFLIDCDNCERYGPDGVALSRDERRRAMTPNWDDPAIPAGTNPHLTSDRYSLALIFLRVVGAANFPVQARQRQGGRIAIDFPIPPGYAGEVLLGQGSPLWDLCSRGLSTGSADSRPSPGEWVAALETVLDGLGAAPLMRSVWSSQGGGPVRFPADLGLTTGTVPRDVSVRPVVAASRLPPPRRVVATKAPPTEAKLVWRARNMGAQHGLSPGSPPAGAVGAPGAGIAVRGRRGGAPSASASTTPADPVFHQIRAGAVIAFKWWVASHRAVLKELSGPSRPYAAGEAVQRIALCAAVDLVVALLGLFVVAMAVAPILGL